MARNLVDQITPDHWDSAKPEPGSGFRRVRWLQQLTDLLNRPVLNRLSASTNATVVNATGAVLSTGVGSGLMQPKRYTEFTVKARVSFNLVGGGNGASAPASTPASWMLSAGIFHMPVVTGGSSNFIDLAFRVAFCRFSLPFGLPGFTNLDATMRTALGGGSHIGYAIYDDSKNLVWQSGAFLLTNSATQKLVSFVTPALTLAPGSYYLAWSSDTVNVSTWGLDLTPLVFLSGSSDANVINQGPIPTFGYAANPATNAASLTFPATLGALTAYAGGVNNFCMPYVFFRP
jgi:hypothetical protein